MTVAQAIELLEQVTAQITTTRQAHVAISQAIQVLKTELAKEKK